MESFDKTVVAWLRHKVGWSNSPQSWAERGIGLLLAGGVVAAIWYGGAWPRAFQVLAWGGLLVAWAVLLRRGWVKLFGPVLFYDLVRIARRTRYTWLRVVYAIFLLLILWSVYANHASRWDRTEMDYKATAAFAESFFRAFIIVQFVAVGLLTPAYTAGAIADEKERKTLEFLLATDLENREIVLSKVSSRLCNLAMLILTGLPILGFTQFFGGVDPDLVLVSFAATGLTMLALASLSILCSVYAKKTRNAIVMTYLAMLAYMGLSGALTITLLIRSDLASLALTWGSDPITVGDVAKWLNVANPIVVMYRMAMGLTARQPFAEILAELMEEYAVFCGVITAVCLVWAVIRVRPLALQQAYGGVKKRLKGAFLRRKRPAMTERPMIWKEVWTDPGFQFNWMGRVFLLVLIIASLVPPVWIAYDYFLESQTSGRMWRMDRSAFQWAISWWVRIVGTAVACLTLLGVAVRASSNVSGERDRQTIDGLLTSPLRNVDILYAKWLGSVASARWGWVWLGIIWGIGVVAGGLHILAVPLVAVAWTIFASALALIGLFYSTYCRTTLRASIATLITVFIAAVGHWLPWLTCCVPLMIGRGGGGEGMEHVAFFQMWGLTPPLTLGLLAFHGDEFEPRFMGPRENMTEFVFDAVLGLGIWTVAALVIWSVANQRFAEIYKRQA
jgi:ABC-type transport system involved in multi-copper enzyme maturation permease subunit